MVTAMATSGPVITAFSDATLDPPSTVDRMLRVLRPVGMAPMGVPGRGKTIGNFTPFHLACLLLGYAGAQPSDAADAAATLLPFERHGSQLPNGQAGPREPRIPGTLGEVLETIISDHSGERCAPNLLLSISPPEARIAWHDGITEIYGPKKGVEYSFKYGGILRQTFVKSSMIALAASIWRDTPKNESTASLPGETAPALTRIAATNPEALVSSDVTAAGRSPANIIGDDTCPKESR